MTHLFVLWFALFASQSTTPATPPLSEPPATQPAQPPSPIPDASGIHQVGGGVTPPQVINQPAPQYSKIARKQKITGTTTVSLIVDAEGNPQNVHVAHSLADNVDKKHQAAALSLDQAALDAVKKYKFIPAKIPDGKPVPVIMNVEVNFRIY
jgi:protein TonB